jgi:DHA1 family bicyclomycin/chloramphenicol resistance-like MFS transporter
MAQISMIFGIAPAIAPVVGAWLVAWGSWHTLFWALVVFTALLLMLCFVVLPETHPEQSRHSFSPRNLLISYRAILTDSQFIPLATAITFNSAGFFLYIACAPTFVLNILQLDQNQFPWLFVPAISGLVLGAMIAGRLAGRISMRVLVGSGYTIILAASALNILIGLSIDPARVPWMVLPIFFAGIGVNLASPTINLLVLDRFPRYRGGASSVQAFLQLTFSALLAGALGPILSGSALHLALASAGLYVIGFLSWRWYRLVARRIPAQVGNPGTVSTPPDL